MRAGPAASREAYNRSYASVTLHSREGGRDRFGACLHAMHQRVAPLREEGKVPLSQGAICLLERGASLVLLQAQSKQLLEGSAHLSRIQRVASQKRPHRLAERRWPPLAHQGMRQVQEERGMLCR